MPRMVRFWEWLESRPDRTAAMDEWQQVLGGGESRSVAQRFLKPLETPSTAYPNSRRRGFPLKYACQRDGDILVRDETDNQAGSSLLAGDVVRYRLCLHALRSSLANALNRVCVSRTPVDQDARTIQIGNWEPKKSAMFPVHLLIHTSTDDLKNEVYEQIIFGKRRGAILLTPTRMHWCEKIIDAVQLHNTLLVPLCEVVEASGDALRQTPEWDQYLKSFAEMISLKLPSNYQYKEPLPKRATLMAKTEKVKHALVDHIRSARSGVVANLDAGNGATLVKFLTKTQLGNLAGLEPYHITRCLNADPQLRLLYEIANDPEQLLRYGK